MVLFQLDQLANLNYLEEKVNLTLGNPSGWGLGFSNFCLYGIRITGISNKKKYKHVIGYLRSCSHCIYLKLTSSAAAAINLIRRCRPTSVHLHESSYIPHKKCNFQEWNSVVKSLRYAIYVYIKVRF